MGLSVGEFVLKATLLAADEVLSNDDGIDSPSAMSEGPFQSFDVSPMVLPELLDQLEKGSIFWRSQGVSQVDKSIERG